MPIKHKNYYNATMKCPIEFVHYNGVGLINWMPFLKKK